MFLIFFFISLLFAGEIGVYAESMKVYKDGKPVYNYISNEIPFAMASQHISMAMMKSEYGWEYIMDTRDVDLWYERTIKHKDKLCNYEEDALGCSVRNQHYYLRTTVELGEEEAVITQMLFDKNAKVVATATASSRKIIRWIKQQEVTIIQEQSMFGSRTITHMPKEELPLKWEIPWRIFSSDFRQLSLRLWSGTKLQ